MYKHILIPTDGSELSQRAAVAAVELARVHGARVTGLFAAPSATPLVYGEILPVGYATPRKHEAMIKQAAQRHLAVIERAAGAAKVAYELVSVTDDFPADAILSAAKRLKCDLIFMASHGRRGLKSVLLGSETQKVLAQAKSPVLVFR
jgi:nucleotide-binding universal stress UspA family protein